MPEAASSLYIHVPFCVSKCAYCDFFSVKIAHNERLDAYGNALLGDISAQYREGKLSRLKTIYFGGGTPALLECRRIESILAHIERTAGIDSRAEITLEANLRDITKDFLRGADSAGITRLSVGVQSLNDASLSAVKRNNGDSEGGLDALSLWTKGLSIDMIAGLPYETERTFARGLETILACRPSHVSLYALAVEKGTPLERAVRLKQIPYDSDAADSLWLSGRALLESRGLTQYEVSNFARPGCECAHNLCYWRLQSYAGAGAGAVGTIFFERPKNGGYGLRYSVTKNIDSYIGRYAQNVRASETGGKIVLPEPLDKKTVMFERLMMGFRTLEGIDADDFFARFGESLEEKIGAKTGVFAEWKKTGLAHNAGGSYALTREGILFLNKFLEAVC
jgi:oxygen-independent coproporphyrinogen-3 oxidase